MESLKILGVRIDAVTAAEALGKITSFLDSGPGHYVVTPNPEMLVQATRQPRFRDALNASCLAIPDGTGLRLAARMRGRRLPERVTGTDLTDDLAALAAERGFSVFLLGAAEGVARAAAEVLRGRYPGLKVVGATDGGKVGRDAAGVPRIGEGTLAAVRQAAPDILLVAFGHGTQEEWIAAHLDGLPSVRVAVGVGGAFDFISGRVRRAPAWMRRSGLEWLWRLIQEPWRWRRIWRAVVVFPLLVLTRKG